MLSCCIKTSNDCPFVHTWNLLAWKRKLLFQNANREAIYAKALFEDLCLHLDEVFHIQLAAELLHRGRNRLSCQSFTILSTIHPRRSLPAQKSASVLGSLWVTTIAILLVLFCWRSRKTTAQKSQEIQYNTTHTGSEIKRAQSCSNIPSNAYTGRRLDELLGHSESEHLAGRGA